MVARNLCGSRCKPPLSEPHHRMQFNECSSMEPKRWSSTFGARSMELEVWRSKYGARSIEPKHSIHELQWIVSKLECASYKSDENLKFRRSASVYLASNVYASRALSTRSLQNLVERSLESSLLSWYPSTKFSRLYK